MTVATIDPIRNASQWHKARVRGVPTPGSIPKGGIKGFLRETGWDEKTGKGTEGATLTLSTRPPAKGGFTFQLFTPRDFADWDAFVANVLSIDPALQKASGLSIYHPALAAVDVTTVVVKSYSVPQHMGKGLYNVEVQFLEWVKPPAVNITSTTDTTSGDSTDSTAPPPVDPRIQALQEQIALRNQAAKAP